MPSPDDVVLSGDALDIFAAAVSSNVSQLAWATDSVIAYEERQKRYYAKALIDLYEGIAAIPPMIRSCYLDDLLERSSVAISAAWRDVQDDPT